MRLVSSQKPLVLLRAPRVGLANMLITWSRAIVFARLNDLPWRSYGWSMLRPGPWLRGEQKKRLYQGMFRSNMNWFQIAAAEINVRRTSNILLDPEPQKAEIEDGLIVFQTCPKGPDFFAGLQPHTEFVKQQFNQLLTDEIHRAADKQSPVAIACHIRHGDFIADTDPRYSTGGEYCRTPLRFFRDAILQIRSETSCDLPVTLFTNGHPNDLQELLELPNVSFATRNTDITDLVRMSRADYLVTSAWSSFSYLAGYLGDAAILRFPYPQRCPIRHAACTSFEGTLEEFTHYSRKSRSAA